MIALVIIAAGGVALDRPTKAIGVVIVCAGLAGLVIALGGYNGSGLFMLATIAGGVLTLTDREAVDRWLARMRDNRSKASAELQRADERRMAAADARRAARAEQGTTDTAEPSDRQLVTALVLGLFLGGFGAHRFYAGKHGTAVAMIFTLGGLGVWALVDLIMIASGKFRDGAGRAIVATAAPPHAPSPAIKVSETPHGEIDERASGA